MTGSVYVAQPVSAHVQESWGFMSMTAQDLARGLLGLRSYSLPVRNP